MEALTVELRPKLGTVQQPSVLTVELRPILGAPFNFKTWRICMPILKTYPSVHTDISGFGTVHWGTFGPECGTSSYTTSVELQEAIKH
jgi:hypothetical protein